MQVLDRPLLIVTGKGGVGRSAVAAALALRASAVGRRVLALATDDGSGLARHLGTGELTAVPRKADTVSVARIEPAAALDEYLRVRTSIPRVRPLTRLFSSLAETVPGIRDTIVTGKIAYDATRPDWDAVVVDGPPVGQIMSYLTAPQTIAGLVPTGAVKEQAAWMQDTLAGRDHTGIVVVATPEDLPVTEATETISAIEQAAVADVAAVVANMVVPDHADDDVPRSGAAADAAALTRAVVARQEPLLTRLGADRTVPFLPGRSDAPSLARWISRCLETP